VFPEEWEPFTVPRQDARLQDAFLQAHRNLFQTDFWLKMQQSVRAGELHIGLPYAPRHPELQRIQLRTSGPAETVGV
jgi:isocitrate dehydrogenase kinase/phosphatase